MAAATLVYTTCPDAESAARIGRTLVAERFCACVNVIPAMRAIYRWEGAIEEASEAVLIAKTVPERATALGERLRALHPYREPCILVLPVTGGSAGYLAWLAAGAAPA